MIQLRQTPLFQESIFQIVALPADTIIHIHAGNGPEIKKRAMYWAKSDFARRERTSDHIEMGGRAGWHLYQDLCKFDKRATLTSPPSRLTDHIEHYEYAFYAAYIEAYILVCHEDRRDRKEARQAETARPALKVAECAV